MGGAPPKEVQGRLSSRGERWGLGGTLDACQFRQQVPPDRVGPPPTPGT